MRSFHLVLWSVVFSLLSGATANAEAPLAFLQPVKTDHPQDTLRTFMTAMDTFREAKAKGDLKTAEVAMDQAVQTLDTSRLPEVLGLDAAREAAVLLKEVIDRVIVIDYTLVPPGDGSLEVISPWRLKSTEIMIHRVQEGDRKGEFLFHPRTIARVKSFYEILKKRPYLEGSGQGAGYKDPWLQEIAPDWLKKDLLGLKRWQVLGIFFAILGGLLIRRLSFLLGRLALYFSKRTKSQLDDRIVLSTKKPLSWVVASLFWFSCLHLLQFDGLSLSFLTMVVQITLSIGVIWTFYQLAGILADYLHVVVDKADMSLDEQILPILRKSIRIFVVVFGTLVAFQNLGINVMSLIAGLGLGGLAFALAAKDMAANFFGSLMIFTDSPFRIGDWVKFPGVEGTVESVGFRSTKIRTFYNSLVSVPNSEIANASVDNMGRRQYRRVSFELGVTYATPPESLEAFLEGIKEIIRANEFTRKDYFHVFFTSYGPSSLNIMLYYFLKVPDWSEELIQKQNINIEILRLSKSLGVEFAFPTQSLHVESMPKEKKPAPETKAVEKLVKIAKSFGQKGEQAKPQGLSIFVPPSRG